MLAVSFESPESYVEQATQDHDEEFDFKVEAIQAKAYAVWLRHRSRQLRTMTRVLLPPRRNPSQSDRTIDFHAMQAEDAGNAKAL